MSEYTIRHRSRSQHRSRRDQNEFENVVSPVMRREQSVPRPSTINVSPPPLHLPVHPSQSPHQSPHRSPLDRRSHSPRSITPAPRISPVIADSVVTRNHIDVGSVIQTVINDYKEAYLRCTFATWLMSLINTLFIKFIYGAFSDHRNHFNPYIYFGYYITFGGVLSSTCMSLIQEEFMYSSSKKTVLDHFMRSFLLMVQASILHFIDNALLIVIVLSHSAALSIQNEVHYVLYVVAVSLLMGFSQVFSHAHSLWSDLDLELLSAFSRSKEMCRQHRIHTIVGSLFGQFLRFTPLLLVILNPFYHFTPRMLEFGALCYPFFGVFYYYSQRKSISI
eukprot:TRINITY_DN2713_c0_g1_i1.p1 TRINITY_DN2713_c0_g1~~TRINITY_DN2713_c0_g1_i1.p1  ORF type:complete len:334 (-),score=42.31 TRINITY_DN2713_c0_g1_i1:197-1198(-)